MTGPLKAANGTAGAPSITFGSDTDSGFIRKAANSIAIVTEGVERIVISTAAASFATELIASATASFLLTANFSSVVKSASTSHWLAPVGTTGQRPTPAEGMFRQNSTTHSFEYYNGSAWVTVNGATSPLNYIAGCILSNSAGDTTNDISITAGVCRDSTNTVDITVAAMATGKKLDANWAPGDAAGMRNSAVGIANGTYHIYAVAKADGTQDIYAHTSTTVATVITALQAETSGASYIYARRIGSILREGAAIVGFVQDGDFFQRSTSISDIAATNPGASAVTRTLSVPVGIRVRADVLSQIQNSGTGGTVYSLLSDLSVTDETPAISLTQTSVASNGAAGVLLAAAPVQVWTNTSAQIRSRLSFSDASVSIGIRTRGWLDTRGKDA